MRPKSSSSKKPAEQVVKDIRRATRRHFSAEDKIRIVLDKRTLDQLGIARRTFYRWYDRYLDGGPEALDVAFHRTRRLLALHHRVEAVQHDVGPGRHRHAGHGARSVRL